ncbi:MAG: zeta toxin family protein [Nitrospinae bacterium]|nr:zeta toxin family protein [Nitrospinota bacterium]
METAPRIFVIAGPNGSGKSTSAPFFLRELFGILTYVNADAIASGLSAFAPEREAIEAGRIMLRQIHRLRGEKTDFAFETTLASRSYAPWLKSARAEGYEIYILFLSLQSPEAALSRVAERVRLGGHDIPRDVVIRRFHRGLGNFFNLYLPVCDRWFLLDNSNSTGPVIIANGGKQIPLKVEEPETFDYLKGKYGAG